MTQQASVFDRLAGIGWNESVPPNGFVNRRAVAEDPYNDNPLGLATPVGEVEIETTPEHRNLVAGDPRCADWTRSYDDPGVVALRQRLRERNGIPGLEVVAPDDVERAAALFRAAAAQTHSASERQALLERAGATSRSSAGPAS